MSSYLHHRFESLNNQLDHMLESQNKQIEYLSYVRRVNSKSPLKRAELDELYKEAKSKAHRRVHSQLSSPSIRDLPIERDLVQSYSHRRRHHLEEDDEEYHRKLIYSLSPSQRRALGVRPESYQPTPAAKSSRLKGNGTLAYSSLELSPVKLSHSRLGESVYETPVKKSFDNQATKSTLLKAQAYIDNMTEITEQIKQRLTRLEHTVETQIKALDYMKKSNSESGSKSGKFTHPRVVDPYKKDENLRRSLYSEMKTEETQTENGEVRAEKKEEYKPKKEENEEENVNVRKKLDFDNIKDIKVNSDKEEDKNELARTANFPGLSDNKGKEGEEEAESKA